MSDDRPSDLPPSSANSARIDKQAVVVIHGMGEQIPMDTIKGFVRTVWELDKEITANGLPYPTQVWSKPDARTGSLELRRVTTRESIKSPPEYPDGVRTDFYEMYWADLSAGTSWRHFVGWVRNLLFRRWKHVPNGMHSAWLLLWAASLCVLFIGFLSVSPEFIWSKVGLSGLTEWRPLLVFGGPFLAALLHNLATRTFGRVVRYTRADPDNIAAREKIRKRGLDLLSALHDGNSYKRIVIVAHSLGSILALDLISYFWSRRESARTISEGTPEFLCLCALEKAAAQVDRKNPTKDSIDAYFSAQRALRLSLSRRPTDQRWLISDFVTLGSPLTHAEFLLARDKNDLRSRIVGREIPESPPFRESLDPKNLKRAKQVDNFPIDKNAVEANLISYPHPGQDKTWILHHAAPFSAVRWTNIYDSPRWVFRGDIIGGPVSAVLGPAVVDVDLKKLRNCQSWAFTHGKYWAEDGDAIRINALRSAINLLDRPNADPNVEY